MVIGRVAVTSFANTIDNVLCIRMRIYKDVSNQMSKYQTIIDVSVKLSFIFHFHTSPVNR